MDNKEMQDMIKLTEELQKDLDEQCALVNSFMALNTTQEGFITRLNNDNQSLREQCDKLVKQMEMLKKENEELRSLLYVKERPWLKSIN